MYDGAETFNSAEAIDRITKHGCMKEVHEIHVFKGTWHDQDVRITIRDYGPHCSNPESRYCCSAVRGEREKEHTANPGGTLSAAIQNIHWRTIHS